VLKCSSITANGPESSKGVSKILSSIFFDKASYKQITSFVIISIMRMCFLIQNI